MFLNGKVTIIYISFLFTFVNFGTLDKELEYEYIREDVKWFGFISS